MHSRYSGLSKILLKIFDPRLSGYVFAAAVLVLYGFAPLGIYAAFDRNPYMLELGYLSILAAVFVVLGFRLSVFDGLMRPHKFRIPISSRRFHMLVWGAFFLFLVWASATAPAVPLWSALFGEFSTEELDLQRGAFLKTREGWEASLGYISGVFAGALLPYSMGKLFVQGSRFRFPAFGLFVLYSMLFLQKALFVQVVAPLAYLSARRVIWSLVGLFALVAGSIGLLYINTLLSRGVEDAARIEHFQQERRDLSAMRRSRLDEKKKSVVDAGMNADRFYSTGPWFEEAVPVNFFTSRFKPTSAQEHIIWRAAAVPVFTAADALEVLDERFDGRHLYGATSSMVAATFGMDRVNYDAEVYALQWGATDIGRANSVYVTDGFVNFGLIGVAGFSLLVGLGFRVFAVTNDEALRATWPLFAYNLFQASFIGTLLSSGFALIFVIALFVKFDR